MGRHAKPRRRLTPEEKGREMGGLPLHIQLDTAISLALALSEGFAEMEEAVNEVGPTDAEKLTSVKAIISKNADQVHAIAGLGDVSAASEPVS